MSINFSLIFWFNKAVYFLNNSFSLVNICLLLMIYFFAGKLREKKHVWSSVCNRRPDGIKTTVAWINYYLSRDVKRTGKSVLKSLIIYTLRCPEQCTNIPPTYFYRTVSLPLFAFEKPDQANKYKQISGKEKHYLINNRITLEFY